MFNARITSGVNLRLLSNAVVELLLLFGPLVLLIDSGEFEKNEDWMSEPDGVYM